jgi:hypothetical protein
MPISVLPLQDGARASKAICGDMYRLLTKCSYIVDWYELEGLYAKDSRKHRPPGLAEAVRPPPTARGESAEFSPVPKSTIVKLHYLEFDGKHVGRRPRTVTIAPFEGERAISMLPVFPAEFAPDPKIRETLVARGRSTSGFASQATWSTMGIPLLPRRFKVER